MFILYCYSFFQL